MRPNFVVLGSIAIVVLSAIWFFTNYEKVPDSSYTGFSGQARVNSFFAVELLLEELDIDVDSRATLEPSKWLPDYKDTLFTRLSVSVAVGDERAALEEWVASGGHLVVMPSTEKAVLVDVLLEEFGYEFVDIDRSEDEENADTDEEAVKEYDYFLDTSFVPQRIGILDEGMQTATLSDDYGIIAARGPYGSGYVTVVSSSYIFTNSQLNESDHARLLLDIVAGYLDPGKVWLIFDASFTPLYMLIWNNAPYAVLGAAALLFIALWAAMPVFGPRIFIEKPVRRSIIEHIKAAGTFVWKQHGSGELARSSTEAVLHEAEGRHPGINRLSRTKQAELIARVTGLEAQTILDAITSDGDMHMREFTQQMEILHQIRKEL